MKSKPYLQIIALLATVGMLACSAIDEGECKVNYINYRYLNNVAEDATEQIYKMTDFIFSAKDSVLFRVDDNIMNGKMRKRPITLPDGAWIIVTYGNLNGGSRVNYTLGQTRMSEMSTRVINTPTYKGAYASRTDVPSLRIGDSDKLYFGKLDLVVSGGYTDRTHTVELSNVHIWLSAVVKWKDATKAPTKASSNLHVRLEYVPVEHSFMHDDKKDATHNIPYRAPKITSERASHISQLHSSTTASDGQFYFNTYGLRWETGKAPTLRFYNGEDLILNKDLDLNRYFSDQSVDLTATRVQFYQLQILIDGDRVTISNIGIEDWEDGGAV